MQVILWPLRCNFSCATDKLMNKKEVMCVLSVWRGNLGIKFIKRIFAEEKDKVCEVAYYHNFKLNENT